MREINKIAEGLFEKIRDRFEDVSLGDDKAKATQDPEQARFFNFDYVVDGHNHGNITMSLIDETSLKVYFSKNISSNLDEEHKKEWYRFLRELREFARRNLLSFEPRDITRSTLKHRDIQQQSKADSTHDKDEVVAESRMYGTMNRSYESFGPVRIKLQHTKPIVDETHGARSRNIAAVFVENDQGERFRLPFTNLTGARAMARHVSAGGVPTDELGQHIAEMVNEMLTLRPFIHSMRHRTFEDVVTKDMIESAFGYHGLLKSTLKKMKGKRGYTEFKESFKPALVEDDANVAELKELFVKKTLDERVEQALPLVHKAYNMMKENNNPFAQQFESWANNVAESWDEDQEGVKQWGNEPINVDDLADLFADEIPVGVDAINAISALRNVINNNDLESKLLQLSQSDPKADARDTIISWLYDNIPAVYQELENEIGDPDYPAEPGESEGGDLDEGAEFGAYTTEKLAQLIYNDHPDLPTDGRGDEFFEVAYPYVVDMLGKKSARHKLNYDEDFPADLISDYAWLQKHSEDKDESTHGVDIPGGTENMLATTNEGEYEDDLANLEAVQSAIIRRILHGKHHNLLRKLGPDGVMQAAEDEARNACPVEEIGSSDVSAWVQNIYSTHQIPLEDEDEEKEPSALEEAFNQALGDSYDTRDAYELDDPKHPDFVKNYQEFKAKNPGATLADFIAHLRSRKTKTNEDTITEDQVSDKLQALIGQTLYVKPEGRMGQVVGVAPDFRNGLIVQIGTRQTVAHYGDLSAERPGPVKQALDWFNSVTGGGAIAPRKAQPQGQLPMDMKEDILKLAGLK